MGPLWRSIALKRSQAALKTADFLGFQPRLTLTSYEARDYRRKTSATSGVARRICSMPVSTRFVSASDDPAGMM